MSRDDDDPRLSARAVGETGSGDAPLTPAEQAEVDSLRATADLLRAGLAAEPMPALDPARRAAILGGSTVPKGLSPVGTPTGLSHEPAEPGRGTVPGSVFRFSEYSGLGALAATLLLVVGFGIAGATGGEVSVRHYSTTGSAEELVVVDGDLDSLPELGDYLRVRSGVPVLSAGLGGAGGGGGGGVGVPANGSGKPSSGTFYNFNADGGYRGRTEHIFDRTLGAEDENMELQVARSAYRKALQAKDSEIVAKGKALGLLEATKSASIADLRRAVAKAEAVRVLSESHAIVSNGVVRGEYLAENFDKFTVGGGVSEQTIYLPREGKLPFNIGTGGFEEWVMDRDGLVTGEGPTTESHPVFVENPWVRPYGEAALSTFSIDVDTAGYSLVRRCLVEQNRLPPPGALRVEELLNYFPYEYAGPTTADPFAVHVDAAACPWAPAHRLVRIALKGREVEEAARPPANLVFLVDVSGSMDQPNKLPLVQQSMAMLADGLTARDRIAMVVYAGNSGLVLPSTAAGDHGPIREAIGRLKAGGSTNGGAGIDLAYKVAGENFIQGGINRVVLATDGDFNVGVSDPSALVKMVEEKAKGGVFLTALGYGMDNLKDSTLEQLADKGNGNYGYVDNLAEARKVLVEQGMSTLHCIAKDVKIQVEFNPAKVAGYRLLGYENRVLAAQDFADDRKDAGEIGAGHAVTALYEVVPAGVEVPGAAVDELRFQRPGAYAGAAETLLVKLRWKEPEGQVSTPREFPFVDGGLSFESGSDDLRFAAAVAAFGMVLRGSKEAGSANLDLVREIAAGALGSDPGGWRAEFLTLVEKARALRK